jgi:hypothetical protein
MERELAAKLGAAELERFRRTLARIVDEFGG